MAEGLTSTPAHSHLNLTYNEVNEDVMDQSSMMNHSIAVESVHHYNTQLGADDHSDVQLHKEEEDEEVVWEIRTPSPPPPVAIFVYRPDDVTSHVFTYNDVEEQLPPAPSGYSE